MKIQKNRNNIKIPLKNEIINEKEINSSNQIKIGSWNANGLYGKFGLLVERMIELDLDWVWVCENQWEENVREPVNNLSHVNGQKVLLGRSNYGSSIIHNPRRKPVGFEVLHIGERGCFQLWRWKGCLFLGVYCPFNIEVMGESPFDHMIQAVDRLRRENEPLILLGDFNKNLEGSDNYVLQALRARDLQVAPTEPDILGEKYSFSKFVRGRHTKSLIDYFVFSEEFETPITCVDYHYFHSDHFLIYSSITIPNLVAEDIVAENQKIWKTSKLEDKKKRKEMEDNFRSRYFPEIFTKIQASTPGSQSLIDSIYLELVKTIESNAMDVIGRWNGRRHISPYVSEELRDIHRAYRKLRAHLAYDMETHDDYINGIELLEELRCKIKDEAEGSIRTGFYRYVESIDNMESHKIMRTLCQSKRKRTRKRTNMLSSNPEDLKKFGGHFKKQFSKVEDHITYERVVQSPTLEGWGKEWEKVIFSHTVARAMAILPTGKASGISGISAELVKYCGFPMAQSLAALFSKFIQFGLVPSCWREVKIIPIPKVQGSRDIADYRPISLTEVLRKLFERCILEELKRFIEPLDLAQGGFRRNRGTIETIASLQETVLQFERKNKRQPIILFLDIKAAYDSVDHDLLLLRLKERKCPEPYIRITEQLMCGITSRVYVDSKESVPFLHEAGVLQGSIISPMLYSLYIDTLADSVRRIIPGDQSIFMYADDVAIVIDHEGKFDLVADALESHSYLNNYRFNPRKCEIMNATNEFKLYGEPIPRADTFKYLGCMMDKYGIRWDLHFSRLRQKTLQVLNFFKAVGYNSMGFRERTRLMLFKTFLRPLYEYCLCIMPYNAHRLNLLDRLQHECLCALFSVSKNTSKATLRALTGVPSMHQRWRELTARWAFRTRGKNEFHMITVARKNSKRHLKRRSCFSNLEGNPILATYDGIHESNEKYSLDDAILFHRYEHLKSEKGKSWRIAEICLRFDCKPSLLYQLSRTPRLKARLLELWMLGKIPGKPKRCLLCNSDSQGWRHLANCSGIYQNISLLIANFNWETAVDSIRAVICNMSDSHFFAG